MSKQPETFDPEKAAQILQKGSVDDVIELFDKYGRDFSPPPRTGSTLYHASYNVEHPEVLHYLIHYQNFKDEINQSANDRGVPLIGAAFMKNLHAIKILIANGASYKDTKFRTVNDFTSFLLVSYYSDKKFRNQVAEFIAAYEKGEDLVATEKLKVEAILEERQQQALIKQMQKANNHFTSAMSFFGAIRCYITGAGSVTNPTESETLLGGPPPKVKRE